MLVRIPKAFHDDCSGRQLPVPPVTREEPSHYFIDVEHPAFAELVREAREQASPWRAHENLRRTAAARSMLRSLLKAGLPVD